MRKIGIITLSSEPSNYIEALKSSEYTLIELKEDNFDEEINCRIDIILIDSEKMFEESRICKWVVQIREKTDVQLWVIQNTKDEFSRIIYLQLGSDRVITNDCSIKEFNLSLDNILKKRDTLNSLVSDRRTSLEKRGTKLASILLDDRNRSVNIDGSIVQLTIIEYKIMRLLCSEQGMAFTYEEIQRAIWDDIEGSGRFRVSNVIFKIRQKLLQNGINVDYIKTVRSKGYSIINE